MKMYYHYTNKEPQQFFNNGMYRDSSYTDNGQYGAEEARTKCGIHKPIWVLEFFDDGGFRENRPAIVNKVETRGFIGGARDYIHSGRPVPLSFRKL